MLPLIRNIDTFEKQIKEVKDLGLYIDDEEAQRAANLTDEMTKLSHAFRKFKFEVGDAAISGVEDLQHIFGF